MRSFKRSVLAGLFVLGPIVALIAASSPPQGDLSSAASTRVTVPLRSESAPRATDMGPGGRRISREEKQELASIRAEGIRRVQQLSADLEHRPLADEAAQQKQIVREKVATEVAFLRAVAVRARARQDEETALAAERRIDELLHPVSREAAPGAVVQDKKF